MKRRVLAVDDSSFIRRLVADIVNSFEQFEISDCAKNGIEALDFLEANKYDVVLMDVEMPKLNGIETLRQIVKLYPKLPVIMFSTLTKDGAELTLEALDIGAFDFITKPVNIFKVNTQEVRESILEKLSAACKIRPNANAILAAKLASDRRNAAVARTQISDARVSKKIHRKTGKKLVAIGTSTGGPKALQEVLTKFPKDLKAPIVIVQHMPVGFIEPMSKRLDSMSQIHVKQAQHGEKLENGCCYIAPGGQNMRVIQRLGELYVDLKDDVTDSVHKPSVDALFSSLYEIDSRDIIAVMMTGMGSDGANAMKLLHDAGHYCIVQDKESSTVYGMPGSVVKLGAADLIVSLERLSGEIFKKVEV